MEPQGGSGLSYQVALFEGRRLTCGGAIISPLLILTAAHCLENVRAKIVSVVAGTRQPSFLGFKKTSSEQIRKAEKFYMHKNYNTRSMVNDIAIIKLDSPLSFTVNVSSIRLPSENENFDGNAVVSGWGDTKYGGSSSKTLQFVILPIVSESKCRKAYGGRLKHGTLCAGKTGKDSCQGDSGGPVVCQRKVDRSLVLCGVVSWADGCGKKGFPGINTKVSNFISWIKSKIPSSQVSEVFGQAQVHGHWNGHRRGINKDYDLLPNYDDLYGHHDSEDYESTERGIYEENGHYENRHYIYENRVNSNAGDYNNGNGDYIGGSEQGFDVYQEDYNGELPGGNYEGDDDDIRGHHEADKSTDGYGDEPYDYVRGYDDGGFYYHADRNNHRTVDPDVVGINEYDTI